MKSRVLKLIAAGIVLVVLVAGTGLFCVGESCCGMLPGKSWKRWSKITDYRLPIVN